MTQDTNTDHLAITQLMASYAAGIDNRDRALYRSCFADDLEIVGFSSGTMHGGDTWVDFVWDTIKKFGATQHLLGIPLITIKGDSANARTNVQAFHEIIDSEETFTLWANYNTDMKRTAVGWEISRHELIVRSTRTA